MTKKILFFVLFFAILLQNVFAQGIKVDMSRYKEVWVERDPIKGINPWEAFWLKKNKKRRITQFPRNNPLFIESAEAEIIKSYYLEQGLQVMRVDSWSYKQRYGEQKETCPKDDCPAGYTLFLLIPRTQLNKAQQLGFKEFNILERNF